MLLDGSLARPATRCAHALARMQLKRLWRVKNKQRIKDENFSRTR